MGHYETIQKAKLFLINYGFEVSENVNGEIIYLNNYGDKVTMRKYNNGSCKLY